MRGPWKPVLLGTVAIVAGLWMAVAQRGADADPDEDASPPTSTPPEPITGEPVTPEPGSETGPIDPFAPPAPGDVQVEDLTPAEQTYVAANADVTGWSAVHAGFSGATQEAAAKARAAKAAALLGLEGLGDTGVTP